MFVAICYDIPDDRRRARVAAILLDHGFRVQRSVFEADIPDATFERLMGRLMRVANLEEDSVRAYRLCEGCRSKIRVLSGPEPYDPPTVVVVTGSGPTSDTLKSRRHRPDPPRRRR